MRTLQESCELNKSDYRLENFLFNGVWLKEAENAQMALQHAYTQNKLPMLSIVFERDDLKKIISLAAHYKTFQTVLFLGMGGASFAGQAMASLLNSWSSKQGCNNPRMVFMNNLDAAAFHQELMALNPVTTGVVAISKSGETLETLLMLRHCFGQWTNAEIVEKNLHTTFPLFPRRKVHYTNPPSNSI